MSYNWDLNDKKIWETNEVLKEFEKRLANAAVELAKKAQDGMASEKLKGVGEAAETANKSIGELVETVKRDVADDEELPVSTKEEDEAARYALINELREMAIEASKKGNTKLAYKIERTVDELVFGD